MAYRKETYEKEKKSVSRTDCNNYCNRELKQAYDWLREVDKFALTNAVYNMDSAYQKFFKEHAGYPKFKSKHDSHNSYRTNFTNGNIVVDFEKGKIKLPKRKTVKAKLHREFKGEIKSATVSQASSGKYFVSVLVETEHVEMSYTEGNIGLDLAKSISDVSWYELTRQLKYKSEWNGRKYIKIDTFYASSQICSACGNQNADTKDLSVREWECPVCGAKHDRDINAARNILAEGLRQTA